MFSVFLDGYSIQGYNRGDGLWVVPRGRSSTGFSTVTRIAQVSSAGNTTDNAPATGVDIIGVNLSSGVDLMRYYHLLSLLMQVKLLLQNRKNKSDDFPVLL